MEQKIGDVKLFNFFYVMIFNLEKIHNNKISLDIRFRFLDEFEFLESAMVREIREAEVLGLTD